MFKKKTKEWLWFTLKFVLSLFALIYVLKRVSLDDIAMLLSSSSSGYLFCALLAFIGSKILSAFRALLILKHYSVPISQWDNLKLYWTGMFYNLFLPGGIGGDIFKTVVINNEYRSGIKVSAIAVLMDRIAGVAALIILAFIISGLAVSGERWVWYSITGVPVTLIGFIAFVLLFMPGIKGILPELLGWSFMVQICQVVSLIFILNAFNIESGQMKYLLIFLISSVAAMLPISLGGIGIREMVFFSVSNYFLLDPKAAVTISFAFYLITLLVSSIGIITALERRRNIKPELADISIK
jgi:uncharacterized membrane protein YbhN (UPF0104 family)